MPIKVIITDDHPLITKGINTVLSRLPAITVAGVYHSAAELLRNIAKTKPDVLILDRQLPKTDAETTVRTLLKMIPSLKILMFSSTDNVYQVRAMLDAGCKGYLLKDADEDMLVKAIETVYKGNRFLSPLLEAALLDDQLLHQEGQRRVNLTNREKEVMKLIIAEYTNQEIAEKLFLSPFTIESHRTSILQKLNVKNTAGLVRVAFETGLV
jgi:DNA-binding NarL/FixJ family response regulator